MGQGKLLTPEEKRVIIFALKKYFDRATDDLHEQEMVPLSIKQIKYQVI
ncbi:hypothetical protein [Desulfonatronospira sp.]|nr:hypothetical protein [Desulfonatronospira sp.]